MRSSPQNGAGRRALTPSLSGAVLRKAGLSCSYASAAAFVKLSNGDGFGGVNTLALVSELGEPALYALRSVVSDYFSQKKPALVAAVREIRRAPGKGGAHAADDEAGPLPKTTPGSSGGAARPRRAGRTPASPGDEDKEPDVVPSLAALAVSPAAGEVTPPPKPAAAARTTARTSAAAAAAAASLESAVKAASDAAAAEAEAIALAATPQLRKDIDALSLQACLIAQCRRLGDLNSLSAAAKKTLLAVVGTPGPAGARARMRVEFNAAVPAAGPVPDSLRHSICPPLMMERREASPDYARMLEERRFELAEIERAWLAPSRLLCVSLMHEGVRAWACAFELRECEAAIAYIDSRCAVMLACAGGVEARRTLSEACLLASLAWLGLEHGVRRVHFTSYSPLWEAMSAEEVKLHCPPSPAAAAPKKGAAAAGEKWVRRGPYLLGRGPLSWKRQLTLAKDELQLLQLAGQHKLRVFYARLVELGDGHVLDAAASGQLRNGEERAVPTFGTDECYLPLVRNQLTGEAKAVAKAAKKLPAGAALAYAHLLPVRQLCLVREMEAQGKRQWVYALRATAPPKADEELARRAAPGAQTGDAEALSAAQFAGLAERTAAAWTEELRADEAAWAEEQAMLSWRVMCALREDAKLGFMAATADERL